MTNLNTQIETLIERYGPMVLRRCRQILGDEDLAKDLVQDVFFTLLQKGEKLNLERPSSLLYTMATRLCLNYLRDHAKFLPEGDQVVQDIASLDDLEESTLNKVFLNRFFGSQAQDSRVMAYMHYVDGYTLEETASQLNLSVSGVRKRLRGLKLNLSKVVES